MHSIMQTIIFFNIVCDGNAITNDLTRKIVCDVPTNGNVFLAAIVWDVYTNRKVSRGLTVWDVLTTGNEFACIIVFFEHYCMYNYLVARRSHATSFFRACVPGGHIPNDFWVVWEGPPIAHTHLATVPNAVAERG